MKIEATITESLKSLGPERPGPSLEKTKHKNKPEKNKSGNKFGKTKSEKNKTRKKNKSEKTSLGKSSSILYIVGEIIINHGVFNSI
jgi:hypothetical protein